MYEMIMENQPEPHLEWSFCWKAEGESASLQLVGHHAQIHV